MRLKSYFANSVQAAMEKARIELGAEAMLISSRQTSLDLKDLGAYEVVFGLEQAEAPPAAVSQPAGVARAASASLLSSSSSASAADQAVLRELAELRKQLECLGESVARTGLNRATEKFTPELSRHFDRLVHAGFSPEFAQDCVEAAARRARPLGDGAHRFARDLFEAVLREEIEGRIRVTPSPGDGKQSAAAVLLVGPAGAGKTTSLVKIGLTYGVKARRPLQFLSLDTLRVGGSDQLGRFARLSGADFRPLPDVSVLEAALGRRSTNDLVLIDTPGYGAAEAADAADHARAIRHLPIEVQLVLPATLSLAAAQKLAARFAVFQPSKLLLTQMDELDKSASAIELAARLDLPLSFFGTGQQIPEDLAVAGKAALMESLVLAGERAATAAA